MTHQFNQRELVINLETGAYQINPIHQRIAGRRIIGPVDYGWARYSQAGGQRLDGAPGVFTFGGGPLAGSRIPGTRRLVFCAYSPAWEGFYVSSLGGGAYILHRLGVDFVCLLGAAPQDSVLILNHRRGEIEVRLEPIDPDTLWASYADPEGTPLFGFYALQQAVYDRYGREYDARMAFIRPDGRQDWVRVFAVGPAARHTQEGIIGSNQIKSAGRDEPAGRLGRILPIDDWAGRGGLGSRLLQTHHIAACIFGGEWEDPDLKDSKEIDSYFQTYYGQSMLKVDLGATEKYRYTPGFQTGGTFGVNFHTGDDQLFSYNYTSIYHSSAERRAQHTAAIQGHYLEQFNRECIQPKNFAHCGEPCSVACKKYVGSYKKDYEPYMALGPQCGIFDQRAAEQLNHTIDALGIDAIQMGGMIAWLMELFAAGRLDPAHFGLPPEGQPSAAGSDQAQDFTFFPPPDGEADLARLVSSSQRNADYARQIADMIVFAPAGAPFRQGLRAAARAVDQLALPAASSDRPSDRAVYTAHGVNGCMVPNQYWVPGMLAPMPMMGKYFVYYGVDYLPPFELGRKCVERMVYELFSENSGVCRFHRKWVEAIVDEIIEAHYHFPLDYKAHQFELAAAIYAAEGQAVGFWESERTLDIIWQYLEKWVANGLVDASLDDWVARFRQDKWAAGRQYWEELRQGIAAAFAAGSAAIPEVVAPYQAARLDIMADADKDHPIDHPIDGPYPPPLPTNG